MHRHPSRPVEHHPTVRAGRPAAQQSVLRADRRDGRESALMKRIDKQYLQTPFYGSRKMALELGINRKHAQRLMRLMGLEAVGVKRRTTRPAAGHKIYPYLLRNLAITRPDQVWASDITYIPLRHGFLYLMAVMDWFSRYVLAWRLSNTLEGRFCLEALDEALATNAGDFQQRSRKPVHGGCLHGPIGEVWRGDLDGRSRSGDRQRVHRTAVAEREVRGGVPARLRRRLGGGAIAGPLLRVLLPAANPPGPRLPHAGGVVRAEKIAKHSAIKSLLRQG